MPKSFDASDAQLYAMPLRVQHEPAISKVSTCHSRTCASDLPPDRPLQWALERLWLMSCGLRVEEQAAPGRLKVRGRCVISAGSCILKDLDLVRKDRESGSGRWNSLREPAATAFILATDVV